VFPKSNDYSETNHGLEWPTNSDEWPTTVLIHRVVLCNHPLAGFVLGGDGEKLRVGTRLASAVLAPAAVVEEG
jgi:hypothetical protein